MLLQHINTPINQNFSIATHQQETTIEIISTQMCINSLQSVNQNISLPLLFYQPYSIA